MARTKKLKSTARFGARYGRKVKQKVLDIEKNQKKLHKCPSCNKIQLKRIAMGIYECKKCKTKIAGNAYFPGE